MRYLFHVFRSEIFILDKLFHLSKLGLRSILNLSLSDVFHEITICHTLLYGLPCLLFFEDYHHATCYSKNWCWRCLVTFNFCDRLFIKRKLLDSSAACFETVVQVIQYFLKVFCKSFVFDQLVLELLWALIFKRDFRLLEKRFDGGLWLFRHLDLNGNRLVLRNPLLNLGFLKLLLHGDRLDCMNLLDPGNFLRCSHWFCFHKIHEIGAVFVYH